MHIADAGPNEEMHVNAVARNFIADEGELNGFFHAITRDADVNRRPLWTFQQVSNISGAHVLGGFSVDGNDHVAGVDAGLISGRAYEGENHDDFVVARSDRHAYAVVLAVLFFSPQR